MATVFSSRTPPRESAVVLARLKRKRKRERHQAPIRQVHMSRSVRSRYSLPKDHQPCLLQRHHLRTRPLPIMRRPDIQTPEFQEEEVPATLHNHVVCLKCIKSNLQAGTWSSLKSHHLSGILSHQIRQQTREVRPGLSRGHPAAILLLCPIQRRALKSSRGRRRIKRMKMQEELETDLLAIVIIRVKNLRLSLYKDDDEKFPNTRPGSPLAGIDHGQGCYTE